MADASSRFSVPDSELPGLRALVQTSPELMGEVEKALQGGEPTLDSAALSRRVAVRAGLDAASVKPVVTALWRLALVQQDLGLEPQTFLDRMSARLTEKDESQWATADGEALDGAKECIARILGSAGVIPTSAKAGRLLLEQDRVFCRSRVITDVRPVFDDRAEEIEAYLPFHTLVLAYHEGSEHRECHMAMDRGDILRLRDQLNRALRKEKLVRQNLANAHFTLVETEAQTDD